MNRKGLLAGLCVLALLGAPGARGAWADSPAGALVANYLRYMLLNHVGSQGAQIVAQAPAGAQAAPFHWAMNAAFVSPAVKKYPPAYKWVSAMESA